MSFRRSATALVGAAFAAAITLVVMPATAATADTTTAVIRSAHFSPDTAGVDVYLQPFSGGATTLWISSETYGEVSAYQHLTPGVYVVAMRPHGAPASTPAAVTWTVDAKAGAAYTAAAIGNNAALQAVVLVDDLATVPATTGRVRLVQAASRAPSVSVVANGGLSLAKNLAFGTTTDYTSVPVGTWTVQAVPDAGGAAAVEASVRVTAGSSSTIVVLDAQQGGLGVVSVLDSGGAGALPSGSVDAGAGGTATGVPPWSTALAASGAGLAMFVLVLGMYAARRRVGRRLSSPVAPQR